MRLTLHVLALFIILGASSVYAGETAGDPFVASANRFGNLLAAAFEGPPLWPGVDGRSVRLLLIDRASGRAAAWGGPDAPSVAPVELFQAELLPKSLLDATGDFAIAPAVGQDGRQSVAVFLDAFPSMDEAVAEAVHGAFHLATSPHPTFRLTLLDRAEPHPADWKTTYFRREMLLAMMAYLLDDDDSGLARAAHWREALRRSGADSAASTAALHRVEGVARYVECVARGRMLAGRGAPDNVAIQRSLEIVRDAFAKEWGKPLTQEDEVNAFGAVAGILLRESASPGWEEKVAAGASPVDLLLDGIAPVATDISPVIMESTVNDVARRNEAVAKRIDRVLARLDGEGADLVCLPTPTTVVGSHLQSTGIFAIDDAGRRRVVLIRPRPGTAIAGGGTAVQGTGDADAEFVVDSAICGPGEWIVVPLYPSRTM